MKITLNFNQPITSIREMKRFQLAYFFVRNIRVSEMIGDHICRFLNDSEKSHAAYDNFLAELQSFQNRKWLRSYDLINPSNNIWTFSAKA